MVSIQHITKTEKTLLIQHYKQAGAQLIKERAHAVLLSGDGFSVSMIAQILHRQVKTIRNWIHGWNEERMSSLFPRYEKNENASKLTREQKEEIKKILRTPPSETTLPATFWALPELKRYISATFGVIYGSDRSYHYLLQYSGFSWKLPSPFNIRRNEEDIQKRMYEITQEIASFLHSDDWEIFVQDETRINWEEEIKRAWLRKGKKTIMKLERNKVGQSYFGALNQKTGKHHLIELAWQDTDNIIHALKRLIQHYPKKKICIIWDNAAWHKSKKLRGCLQKGKSLERVHLINLPPHAPDRNPEEHVWKYGKEIIANQHFETFEALKSTFQKVLTQKPFDYKIGEFVLR